MLTKDNKVGWNKSYVPTIEEVTRAFLCIDCGENTRRCEYYMVHKALWNGAVPEQKERGGVMLCIGCLESRIGRQLTSKDFTDAPLNRDPKEIAIQSERLQNRLKAMAK